VLLSEAEPGAQLVTLGTALVESRRVLQVYERYYSGAVPFHLHEARYAEIYRRMQREARPKWGKLIILAATQRLAIEGFLTQGAAEPDDDLWASFVRNGLDQSQHEVHLEATLNGRAYVSGWPTVDGEIRCVPESPYEVIHWRSPDRSQIVALKMWAEGDTLRARLFTSDWIYQWAAPIRDVTWQTPGLTSEAIARGDRETLRPVEDNVAPDVWRADGEAIPNPFAPFLPIVPFVAGARMSDTMGRSDLESAIDIIDRLMTLQLDLLLVSKIMGFPVRWASGIETEMNADGSPKDGAFTTAIERFLTTENSEAKFGQLPAADLRQIAAVVSQTVTELAAATETPSSVLATANMANPVSAEALRAQEIPLVHRVRRHQRSFGPAWVHVARLLSLTLEGTVEPLWMDAEVHSEAALTDALVKQVVSLEVPREAAWEQLPGNTPATVARWRMMRAQQQMEDQLAAALLQPAPTTPATPAPPPTAPPETPVEEVPSG
jgi:hypothetical protein